MKHDESPRTWTSNDDDDDEEKNDLVMQDSRDPSWVKWENPTSEIHFRCRLIAVLLATRYVAARPLKNLKEVAPANDTSIYIRRYSHVH